MFSASLINNMRLSMNILSKLSVYSGIKSCVDCSVCVGFIVYIRSVVPASQ